MSPRTRVQIAPTSPRHSFVLYLSQNTNLCRLVSGVGESVTSYREVCDRSCRVVSNATQAITTAAATVSHGRMTTMSTVASYLRNNCSQRPWPTVNLNRSRPIYHCFGVIIDLRLRHHCVSLTVHFVECKCQTGQDDSHRIIDETIRQRVPGTPKMRELKNTTKCRSFKGDVV